MKEIKIEFEKFEGDLKSLIDSSSNGDKYLLKMVDNEKEDKFFIKLCIVRKIMNGMIGIIDGHFSFDFSSMMVIGVCKITF